MSDRAGIDLNTVQIVSSMGAAVTGAILTSYLGDGGTIAGTAVGAGASTAGFAVYKHYLARTKEKVAPVIAGHARQWSPTTQASSRRAAAAEQTEARTAASPGRAVPSDDRTRPDRGQPDPQRPYPGQADPYRPYPGQADPHRPYPGQADPHRPETWQNDPRQGDPWQTDPRQGDPRQADPRHAATEKMPAFGTARMGATGQTGRDGYTGPGGRNGNGSPYGATRPSGNGTPGGPGTHGRAAGGNGNGKGLLGNGLRGRPRWLVMVASAVAVFLVAMVVITVIEFGTGKPIAASVWGHKATGTTLGNVTGGNSTGKTVTPTVSPSGTTSATPGGVGQTAPQPSSSGTAAPSPSSVPSVSTAPSQSAPVQSAPAQNGSRAGPPHRPADQARSRVTARPRPSEAGGVRASGPGRTRSMRPRSQQRSKTAQ